MSTNLNVAIIQSNLVWENPVQNRINFGDKIENINHAVDVIVLPEMFTTGFTMNASVVAESMQGETVSWMKNLAAKKNAAITGSVVIKENNNYYNRLLFAKPNGDIEYYNKRHTFTLAGEHKIYTAGQKQKVIEYKGWKLATLICYDLRFPVWARNTQDYDVILYVANWPKRRVAAWDALLKARAIENMSYCIGVNRVGLDANNYDYSGHSAVYDVLGEKITSLPVEKEGIEIVEITKNHIEKNRKHLGFLNDKDSFNLIM
ncbi:amidohydrolase [Lacinutrix sp. MedPE-SW]|uniref:amidohydrolase n=1 Tax=Lacinutrix sp. MedPE-SW TaxID=1860087 RepID=UPI00091BF0FD|nr:amidohydrolase [Lacinutrix sp. MedPE-SW]OIQ23663.1 MAG: nitrilase family protein [Lacinutrix sp. MedPE-SW]